MNKKFWIDKRVLITGFEGFLGSNLIKALLTTSAKIVGLDIKTHRGETILSRADYKKIMVYKGSVTNYGLLQKVLRKHSINVIFHLAAEAIVKRSQDNPRRAFNTNIAGAWEVLESARQYGRIDALLIASSDKAYGSHRKLPYWEEAPLIANHPYDVSKSCADLIARTYAHTYGLPVVVTRCGNIFGPGDFNLSRIIPDAIKCALTGKELLIRSDGKFTRDYVYVDDIVNGYITLVEKVNKLRLSGEAFNFSNEDPLTVMEVVKEISKVTGNRLGYRVLDNVKHEIKYQYLKSQKAKDILMWYPRYTFSEGIDETIKWVRSSSIMGDIR